MNKLETLVTLFENKILRIPEYQRGYSWETNQLEDLWNDLKNINVFVSNSFHFTGIITLNRTDGDNNLKLEEEGFSFKNNEVIVGNSIRKPYNLVDGQQRMVTLLILISLVVSSLEDYTENQKKEILNKFISVEKNNRHYYLFGYEKDIPSHQYLIGKIFDDKSMTVTEPETVYTKNLEDTKRFFLLKLTQLDLNQRKNLLKKITERLLFYVFEIEPDRLDMSLVFETLNYRGKQLSKLELLKNRLIFLVNKRFIGQQQADLKFKIVSTWQDIYEWLGKNDNNNLNDDEFLREFWIMYFEHDEDTEKEFKNFENDLFNQKYSLIDIRDNELLNIPALERFLSTFSQAIKSWFLINNPTFQPDNIFPEIGSEIREYLQKINYSNIAKFSKTLCLTTLLRNDPEQNYEDIVNVIKAIERHNFSTYLLNGKQADTNRVQIRRLINQYFRNALSNSQLVNEIYKFTIKHISFENINNHIHNNRQRNEKFFDWNGIKYVLWNYEAFLAKKTTLELEEDYKDFTTDLIFPDSYGFGVQFPKVTRNRYGDGIVTLKFSLGNITLTKRKSNPKSFAELKTLLKGGSFNDKEIAKYDDWTDSTILDRGINILNFIEDTWELRIGDEQQKKKLLVENLAIDRIKEN